MYRPRKKRSVKINQAKKWTAHPKLIEILKKKFANNRDGKISVQEQYFVHHITRTAIFEFNECGLV